jgi:hypothetical protein
MCSLLPNKSDEKFEDYLKVRMLEFIVNVWNKELLIKWMMK